MPALTLYPTASHLPTLGPDVLIEILHFVHDTSRPDVFSLLRVNRLVHNLALPFTVRECSLDFEVDKIRSSHSRIRSWLEPQSKGAWVLGYIRRLTVFGTPGEEGLLKKIKVHFDKKQPNMPYEEKWPPILQLIRFLPNLLHFTFACPRDQIPIPLLQALEEARPNIVLNVKHWGISEYRDVRTIEVSADDKALADSPLLRNLEMDHNGGPSDISYTVLQWIIAHSLHLDSITVNPRVGVFRGGCGNAWSSGRRIKHRAGTIFTLPPALPRHKFRNLRLLPAPEEFADFCIQAAELSSLQDLQCRFPLPTLVAPETYIQLTELICLKLRLDVDDSEDADEVLSSLENLLKACGSLKTLSLISSFPLYRVLSTIAACHGASLRSLALLHAPEKNGQDSIVPSSIDDIHLLRKNCFHLRDLTLTATRYQPISDVSDALGHFTSLSLLTLIFPEEPRLIGTWGAFFDVFEKQAKVEGDDISEWEMGVRAQCPVHSSFPLRIFEDIATKGCHLEKLTVKLGDENVRETAQEFVVGCGVSGIATVEAEGYVLPHDFDMDKARDAKTPKIQRLRRLWKVLQPVQSMPSSLNEPLPLSSK
ncbi:hypothetical protein DL96DRAFT_397365 [Flagelloscypha sp. PMI_526]|nr:hypothetical protein DL96DRAFT_397365 [Flagelloscypha sp. PMI_526]